MLCTSRALLAMSTQAGATWSIFTFFSHIIVRQGMLDFKGKAKWDAWEGKKGMGLTEAKEKYIAFAAQLKEKHGMKA